MGELVKDSATTVVTPAVPARAAVPAIALRLYAPPSPVDWCYRTLTSAAGFNNWSPLTPGPKPSVSVPHTQLQFIPLSAFAAGTTLLPAGAVPVFQSGALVGYMVLTTVYTTEVAHGLWFSPPANMEFFRFPSTVAGSNGFPVGNVGDVVTGYVDIPLVSGALSRVSRSFIISQRVVSVGGGGGFDPVQLGQRYLSPLAGDADPPYCRTKPGYGIIMLSDFPGAPGAPGAPAVIHTNDFAGWNAGSNSDAELDGDVELAFNVEVNAAIAVGITEHRPDPVDFETLSHAFYFDRDPVTGGIRFRLMERGRVVYAGGAYNSEMRCRITRESGVVSYFVDAGQIHSSQAPVYGPLRAGSALYRAGDMVY